MLLSLEVRDFVIVDALSLDFETGLTVLTGETGAGKSILIDALSMVLGARAESGWIRAGATRAEVAATFSLPARAILTLEEEGEEEERSLSDWLQDEGFDLEDASLLLRRQIDTQGRSRAWINGRSATAQQLKILAEGLIAIHGQHAHQSLLKSSHQRALLDAYGALQSRIRDVAEAWTHWQAQLTQLKALASEEQALKDEVDRLTRERDELLPVVMSPQDWEELQQEQSRLAHAASLIEGAEGILTGLSEGESPVLTILHQAEATLTQLAEIDNSLKPSLDLVANAVIQLDEAQSDIRRYASRIELDPERLSEIDQRIQAVLSVTRRYRLTPEVMEERLAELTARLETLHISLSPEALLKACAEAEAHYQARAQSLSEARRDTGRRLEEAVTTNIRRLALGEGRFVVEWTDLPEGSRHGNESVVFSWSQYPGQPPTPIAKTASGGELSRMSLALQTVLSMVSEVPTLIFDEVDTGIGGRVAEIVGQLLHEVAEEAQVMCVTHLPQVAAWGDQHLTVSKTLGKDGVPVSDLRQLNESERVEEIARMLGGVTLTETTRAHARELLAQKSS